MLAEEGRARAGTRNVGAFGVSRADRLSDGGAADQRGEPQLIAAGEKHAGRLLDAGDAPGFVGIATGIEIHHIDAGDAQVVKNLDVARPSVEQLTGGRNDHDVGFAATA